MKKETIIHYKKKKIRVVAEDCNLLHKFIGLMFSRRQKAKILLFSFGKKGKIAIHSFFVFYPFLAVWLDDKNKIADLKIVKPFIPYVSNKKTADKLVEIPISRKYDDVLKLLIPHFHSSSVIRNI